MPPPNQATRRIIVVGTYPPRHCGIATFTQDLVQAIRILDPHTICGVYAMHQTFDQIDHYPPEVIGTIDQDDRSSYRRAAQVINHFGEGTVVIIQHEYGIYHGDYLNDLMRAVTCPIITTFHTVVREPPPAMRRLTEQIIRRSDYLVSLTDSSHAMLTKLYPVAETKTVTIPHGIHPLIFQPSQQVKQVLQLDGSRVLLTFGLLSRNKGIEYVLRSLPAIVKVIPTLIYLVIGVTHPNILRQEGEAYRQELLALVNKLKLGRHVRFVNEYLPLNSMLMYLQAADIYLAPSIDPEQTVSGTLSYALGAGRAVVATEFSQAKEIIHPAIGTVVPIGRPEAIATAVIDLFADSTKLNEMQWTAYQSTRSMLWTNVADDYLRLTTRLAVRSESPRPDWQPPTLRHLEKLTDRGGLIQFARGTRPDRASGYTLDDNSRALQVVTLFAKRQPTATDRCTKLGKKYLRVMERCLREPGVVNYLAAETSRPTQQNAKEDLQESLARAAWALQLAAVGPLAIKRTAQSLINLLPQPTRTQHLRVTALTLLAATVAYENGEAAAQTTIKKLARQLVRSFAAAAGRDWRWFETRLTYANGLLSASLLEAARVTSNAAFQQVGLDSLDFLVEMCFMGSVYVPIGQAGWYASRGPRALFDQQPEDAAAMLQALVSAYRLTRETKYVERAHKTLSWFLGNNLLGVRIYDDASGGCHDGLTPRGANLNEGAESTIAYLMASLLMEELHADQKEKNG